MNQVCKVCGEPAAGFHFGAFTCEGCKSFFGRSYNNLNSISECKNNGECVINKKNRTTCKACRLRKCLMVGMSKSGSRYGRRSNWFKIHCLLQEQQQHQQANTSSGFPPPQQKQVSPYPPPLGIGLLEPPFDPSFIQHINKTKEQLLLHEELKNTSSPSVSSPDSHSSDTSVEVCDIRGIPPFFQGLFPPSLFHHNLFLRSSFASLYPGLLQSTNNNSEFIKNHNSSDDLFNNKLLMDAVLHSQKSQMSVRPPLPEIPFAQEDPIDLSMKNVNESKSAKDSEILSALVPKEEIDSENEECSENECAKDCEGGVKLVRPTPLDLTTKM